MKNLILLILILTSCKGELKTQGNYYPNEYIDWLNIGDQSILSNENSQFISGTTYSFLLTTYSTKGSKLTRGGASISINYQGSGSVELSEVIDNQDGTYLLKIVPILVGSGKIFVTANNKVLNTSFQVQILAGEIDPLKVEIWQSKINYLVGDTAQVILTPKDSNGNLVNDSSLNLRSVFTDGTAQASIGSFTYQSNGTYLSTLTAQSVGTSLKLNVSIQGFGVATSSYPINVLTTLPNYTNSFIQLSKSLIKIGQTTNGILYIRDVSGSYLTEHNLPIVIEIYNGSSQVSIGKVKENGSYYIFDISGVSAGSSLKVRAKIDGIYISTLNESSLQVVP